MSYLCDAFYDPVRGEHRRVGFHLLSYSLPSNPESSRAWQLTWDPVFFDMARHDGGRFSFDFDIYRRLDPATRRLFLFASKILYRRSVLPTIELRHLAVDVLGFSPTVAARDLRMKALRCFKRLESLKVIAEFTITRMRRGEYVVRATRGDYFASRRSSFNSPTFTSPIIATLVDIGFTPGAATRLGRRYPHKVLEEWADITRAAEERFGPEFFRKTPMAYLVDSVKKAANGQRTAPDWWHELRRRETARQEVTAESHALFARIRSELFGDADPGMNATERSTEPTTAAEILGKRP